MTAVLERNEGSGGPSTWRGLAAALERLEDSTQTAASWRSTIAKIRRGDILPREPTVLQISRALGVDRSELPAGGEPLTLRAVHEEVTVLRGEVEQLRRQIATATATGAVGDEAAARQAAEAAAEAARRATPPSEPGRSRRRRAS